jgi:addiction module HigA family antidote
MIRVPTHRSPTHPGEMLLEEFLTPMGLSKHGVAEAIDVPSQQLDGIISENQSVTPSIALRLAKFFGMSADFWMNVQLRWDLYHTQQAESETLNTICPHAA